MDQALETLSRRARLLALESDLSASESVQLVIDEAVESSLISESQEFEAKATVGNRLVGYSFLQEFLDDEGVEEVWINEPGKVHFAKSGLHYSKKIEFTEREVYALVERLIRSSGRRIDRSNPFVDARLENGYRFHAVIPDVTREFISINIRKFANHVMTVDELVSREVCSPVQASFLVDALKQGKNILISGATQAGKTTLLSALLGSLPESERVVTVEDTFEIKCKLPDWVAMQTRPASLEGKGQIDLRRLVKETLRMRPTRLVVGEVRGAEALDMLIALNSGIPGMCTIHANSANEALQKITTLPLLAGSNISGTFIESLISTSIHYFVHCHRDSTGSRRIQSIMKLSDANKTQLEPVAL